MINMGYVEICLFHDMTGGVKPLNVRINGPKQVSTLSLKFISP